MTTRLSAFVLLLAALGCDGGEQAAPDASGTGDGSGGHPCLSTATYPLTIQAGAFPPTPAHPSVIVHVPAGFDPTPPVDVVVYIHGFNNCITNVLGDTDGPCTANGASRSAFQLAAQLARSGRNALLVVPEVAFDQATGDPGKLGVAGGFEAMLAETLAALPAPLGSISVAQLGTVIVATHSGGYRAAGAMATIGGVPVDELWLFDSLYGSIADFDHYVTSDLASFGASAPAARRFSNVYTSGGGTLANSQAMATRAAGWVAADPSVLVDDRTSATWADDVYHHGLLFKQSALSHDGVPRYYFEHMLATSALAPRTCP